MRFAREVADRVLMFGHRRIVEEGPPERIFRPGEQRARTFLKAVIERE
jgi:polar amino acid transport system ATP-binding protein